MNEQLIKHQDIQDAQTQAALQDFERRSREADVKVGSMSVQLERAKQEQAKKMDEMRRRPQGRPGQRPGGEGKGRPGKRPDGEGKGSPGKKGSEASF